VIPEVKYKPIGIIHTPYLEKDCTPIQGCFAADNRGRIELYPEYTTSTVWLKGFHLRIVISTYTVKPAPDTGFRRTYPGPTLKESMLDRNIICTFILST
jgi:tRNA (Thr-GGU) A37 N-methylase